MAGSPEGSGSPEAMDTTEIAANGIDSSVTSEQWRAMKQITDNIYGHREKR